MVDWELVAALNKTANCARAESLHTQRDLNYWLGRFLASTQHQRHPTTFARSVTPVLPYSVRRVTHADRSGVAQLYLAP
jgi:hypothetical protein